MQKRELFHDGGRYHVETSPLICPANQWTGFYMVTASVMKELMPHLIVNTSFLFFTLGKHTIHPFILLVMARQINLL